MKHPELPVVDWCQLYGRLAEAVDNAGLEIVDRGAYVDLTPKVEPNTVKYANGPVWNWFGLSYASYMVLPRRSLQSMPTAWQEKFVALVDEAGRYLPDGSFPGYNVNRHGKGRKFIKDPLRDYRHTGPLPCRE